MAKFPLIASSRILVVDDEEDLCEMIADEFRRTGAQVETAYDGETAIAKTRSGDFQIVFTDLRMPNGDGAFVARELKRLGPAAPLVFFYTGNSDFSDEDLGLMGVNRSFKKPRGLNEVFVEIEGILGRRKT